MYSQYDNYPQQGNTMALVNSTMKLVYVKMTFGLIVTAITALLCASTPAYINFCLSSKFFMIGLIIAEFALLFGISGAIRKMPTAVATLLFILFAVVNGMTLFTIFLAYSKAVIYKTFFITAGTFGAMSVYGYFTSRDLSKIGSYLIMALFGLIIAMLVNIFVRSSALDWIVSLAGVFIFVGLTAWDTQQVKVMAANAPTEYAGKLSTIGALQLYLDFLNLFIFLLRIFGGNRN